MRQGRIVLKVGRPVGSALGFTRRRKSVAAEELAQRNWSRGMDIVALLPPVEVIRGSLSMEG
jgi:hypothetical protein